MCTAISPTEYLKKIYNECNMGRLLQLATFHEGIFFLAAYTNVAKGNKLHIEDLVRAVGAGGGEGEGGVRAVWPPI